MNKQLWIIVTGVSMFAGSITHAQVVVDFEQFDLAANSFYNGSDSAGGYEDETSGIHFSNVFTPAFSSWSGFAYSNMTDTTTPGFGNQYSVFASGGAAGSRNFGIAFVSNFDPPGVITLPVATTVESVAIANTTYAALSMLQGDAFAKKFGGATGDDPDFFRLDILGIDEGGNPVGVVEFYLADFRSQDSNQDFVLDDRRTVDLTSLGDNVARLQFAMETTDVGGDGPNTPFYFALDNLSVRVVPEPVTASSLLLGCLAITWCRRRP